MNFKILTIQYYNHYGVLSSEEIDVTNLKPIQIMGKIIDWYKKNRIEIEHVELM